VADGCFGIRTRALLIIVNLGLGDGDGLARVTTVAEMSLTVDRLAGLTQIVQVTKVTMTSENITFIVIPSRLKRSFKTREAAHVRNMLSLTIDLSSFSNASCAFVLPTHGLVACEHPYRASCPTHIQTKQNRKSKQMRKPWLKPRPQCFSNS
jgi:hypothetical protein